MTDPKQKQQKAKDQAKLNVLENLKDLGQGVVQDAVAQVMPKPEPYKKPQNEITNSRELQYIAEQKRVQMMYALEKQQKEEERRISQERLNHLKVQLQALMVETQKAIVSAQEFAQKASEVSYNLPEKVGQYHLNFLQNFLNYISDFAKDIGNGAIWLAGFSGRKNKKDFWGIYKNKKKGGAGYLLSSEHYVQRSAG